MNEDVVRALRAFAPLRADAIVAELERIAPDDAARPVGPAGVPWAEVRDTTEAAVRAHCADPEPILAALWRRVAMATVIAAVLPRAGAAFERWPGKVDEGGTLLDEPCPRCRERAVRYVGSDEIEGTLEVVGYVHVEVEDWFRCACGAAWSETRYL